MRGAEGARPQRGAHPRREAMVIGVRLCIVLDAAPVEIASTMRETKFSRRMNDQSCEQAPPPPARRAEGPSTGKGEAAQRSCAGRGPLHGEFAPTRTFHGHQGDKKSKVGGAP